MTNNTRIVSQRALKAAQALATCCTATSCYSHDELAEMARATKPVFDEALSLLATNSNPDTVAFVQEWMMSGDHDPDQWHHDFAAAIDARFEEETLALSRDGEREAIREIIEREVYVVSDDDRVRYTLEGSGDAAIAILAALATPKHTREAAQDIEHARTLAGEVK
jgi:hypothetical protein